MSFAVLQQWMNKNVSQALLCVAKTLRGSKFKQLTRRPGRAPML